MASSGKSWRGGLILAATSTVVSFAALFLVGELVIRFTKPHSTPETQRARSLEYEAALFARHVFPRMQQEKESRWGNHYSINSRGYRGDEFDVPKPPGAVRVVVLGGSAAFDIRAPEGEDWPSLLEALLRTDGLETVEVVNAAVPGHATWDSLGRLISEIWMTEPDYVVVYHCWNDLKYFDRLHPGNSLLRMYRPKKTEEGSSNLVENPFIYDRGWLDRLLLHSQLYVRLRERWLLRQLGRISLEGAVAETSREEAGASLSTWGSRQFEINLRLLAAAARAAGAEPVFVSQARLVAGSNGPAERDLIDYDLVRMTHERLVQGFAACDDAVTTVARTEDVTVIDASGPLTGNAEYFEDHVHTTSAGSQALAAVVANGLGGLLGDR